jgi:hypothetical protein
MRVLTRRGRRWGATAIGAAALSGGIVFAASPAVAAQGGGECQLSGTANFDPPGLTATGGNFTYSFTGSLSGCNSSVSGAPTQGAIAAGHAYSVTVNGTDPTTGPWSVTYALPQSTGSGGCAQSSTQGTSVTTWPDGTTTVATYTTTGALASVALQGTVVASATLNEVSSTGTVPAGTPTTPTGSTTNTAYPAGDGVAGSLVFSVSDPTQCQTGVTSAGISGAVGLGSAS